MVAADGPTLERLTLPRETHTAGWKIAIFSVVFFAVAFVVFGGFPRGWSARSVALLAASGAFLGAIAAPELEPRAFRQPVLWQMFFAILGSLLFAVKVGAGPVGFAIAVLVGGVLGYFARFWVKYITTP